MREEGGLQNIKFFSLQDFLAIYPYSYNNQALTYLMKTTHVSLDIAKIYLKNLLYDIELLEEPFYHFFVQLKKDMIEKNILKKNVLLENYFFSSKILVHSISPSKYLKKLLKKFPDVSYDIFQETPFTPFVYSLMNVEEEIAFVGEQIIKLIHQGISISNIFLVHVPEDYYTPLNRIFAMMHIPLSLPTKVTLSQTTMGRIFLESFASHEQEALQNIQKLIHTEEDQTLYLQILNILNQHILNDYREDFIRYDLEHTIVKRLQKKNCVTVRDIHDTFLDTDYCFFLAFTKDHIPRVFKDEDYFSDATKEHLGIDTSSDLNRLEKDEIQFCIQRISNLILTYPKMVNFKETFPSELLEMMNLEAQKGELSYNVSYDYDRYTLAKLMDQYTKFKTVTPLLLKLSKTVAIPYRTYKNSFTGISKEKLWNKTNSLSLSYTKLDQYHKCAFSYYIRYILHLDSFEKTFLMKIGNIFHKVLEEADDEHFDFDFSFRLACQDDLFEKKEQVLLKNIKEEFYFTMKTLLDFKKFSHLTNSIHEQKFSIDIPNSIPTTFDGIIDVIHFERNKGNLYYTVTDYKTGSLHFDESLIPLGFHLQLPIYLYLLGNDEFFKNALIGGFYLQPLLIGNTPVQPHENYEITKRKALKKKGFSTTNKEILERVDTSFMDSHCIRSLKVKQDGEFYSSSKVFSHEDEEKIRDIASHFIQDMTRKITDGDFSIDPKIIDNNIDISCEFCAFKDLCYHENQDTIYLESDKSFLKKEVTKNGLDEGAGTSNFYERI